MDDAPLRKDCQKADAIITRYMDGFATNREALWLNEHMSHCEPCKADFLIYDDMLSGFAELTTVPAPDGLEAAVAAKIAACGKVYGGHAALVDKVYAAAWTIASIVLGVGLLAAVFCEQLLALSAESGFLADYAASLAPFAEAVQSAGGQVFGAISEFFGAVRMFVDSNSVVLSVAIGVIFIAYAVFIRDRDAAHSRVDVNENRDVAI